MRLEASRRLRLRDILVLQVSDVAESEEDTLAELGRNLSNICSVPIIVLREGMTIESITEAQMAAAGWVRLERRNNGGG